MATKLQDIAFITSGLVVHRYLSHDTSNFKYNVLNLNSVEDNTIKTELFEEVSLEKIVDSKYLLKKGDIVMKIAEPYSAAIVNFDAKNVIAPSNFIIIRSNKETNSKFLSFYLNSKSIRKQLNTLVEGTILKTIRISSFKELKINFKEKEIEEKYVTLMENLLKKENLRKKQVELEKKIYNYYLNMI